MESQNPRSAFGAGSNQKEPMPLVGGEFLCPWIPGLSVTLGGRADVASPVFLGMLEHPGVELPWNVVVVGVLPAPGLLQLQVQTGWTTNFILI